MWIWNRVLRKEKEESSFFEKKEAKKLLSWGVWHGRCPSGEQKFFGSFFQKRTSFLLCFF
jgi:hypothetical protein